MRAKTQGHFLEERAKCDPRLSLIPESNGRSLLASPNQGFSNDERVPHSKGRNLMR